MSRTVGRVALAAVGLLAIAAAGDRTYAPGVELAVLPDVATDPEDIAWGPGVDGAPALYLADIGDNYRVRPQVLVYVVPEPTLDATARDLTIDVTPDRITSYTLTYPDGPHDAETVLVHPMTGEVTIVTKSSDGLSGIYRAPRPTPRARPC